MRHARDTGGGRQDARCAADVCEGRLAGVSEDEQAGGEPNAVLVRTPTLCGERAADLP